jgi:hypothetical protein
MKPYGAVRPPPADQRGNGGEHRMHTRPGLGLTLALALSLGIALPGALRATETEHYGIKILPAPGKVTVDGKVDDWDLSGGTFVCSDVENLREKLACWFHVMYDQSNLYVLARWIDETPLSNPGSVKEIGRAHV